VGRAHLNRAVEGDIVAVQLLPKDQWKSPAVSVAIEGVNQSAILKNFFYLFVFIIYFMSAFQPYPHL